ncbi:ABC transporter substrate-binding protein [Jeongeupia chitinilytica]|uniref:Sulfate ester-binding protein n=1 Tax=Jeongeupia chitinilytica TaxID=1041641 RepID=A0ABQ3H4J5_9NEIS|nr:ABC transporter substrate-binding protein [Jeongeupia chitinilytica]GHD68203.1 sulfate ester-binding protein [Jeongeupia chitinilytica]
MKTLFRFAAAALAFALGADAIAAGAPKVIRIGVSQVGTGNRPVVGGSTIGVVASRGEIEEEFRKDGIKVEWNYFKGAGPAANEALANKLLDFIFQGDLASLVGRSSGLKSKIIVAQTRNGPGYIAVPTGGNEQNIDDLKGKKLAVFKGTAGQLQLARVFDQKGLAERDFRTINMDTATTQAAIATKDIDGGLFGADIFPLVDRGIARVIQKTGPEFGLTSHVLVTEDFEKQYPEIVQRFVNVVVKTQAWVGDEKNRDQVFQQWAKSGTPYSAFKRDYEGTSLKERQSPLLDENFYAHYRDSLALAKKFKLVRGDIDIDQWFEPKYLKQALKEQKLEGYWAELNVAGKPKLVAK